MAKECYLCGGPLRDGRCTECGLDNTKNDRKYQLNTHNDSGAHFHTGDCEDGLNRKRSPAKEGKRRQKRETFHYGRMLEEIKKEHSGKKQKKQASEVKQETFDYGEMLAEKKKSRRRRKRGGRAAANGQPAFGKRKNTFWPVALFLLIFLALRLFAFLNEQLPELLDFAGGYSENTDDDLFAELGADDGSDEGIFAGLGTDDEEDDSLPAEPEADDEKDGLFSGLGADDGSDRSIFAGLRGDGGSDGTSSADGGSDEAALPEQIVYDEDAPEYVRLELEPGVHTVGYDILPGQYQFAIEAEEETYGTAEILWLSEEKQGEYVILYTEEARRFYGENWEEDCPFGVYSAETQLEAGDEIYAECGVGAKLYLYGLAQEGAGLQAHERQDLPGDVLLENETALTAGADFEPGVYDIVLEAPDDGYSYVYLTLGNEGRVLGGLYSEMGLGLEQGQTTYRRIPLEEGTTLYLEYAENGEEIWLRPSY